MLMIEEREDVQKRQKIIERNQKNALASKRRGRTILLTLIRAFLNRYGKPRQHPVHHQLYVYFKAKSFFSLVTKSAFVDFLYIHQF